MVLQTPRHPGPQETSLFQLTAKMRLSVSDLWDLPTRESKQAGGGCHMGGLSGPLGIEPRPPDSKFSKADGSKIRLDKCRLPTEVFWEAPASLLRQTPLSFPLDNGLIFFLCNFFVWWGGAGFHVSQLMCFMCHSTCVEAPKTTFGSKLPFPPLHGLLRLNSGCQACQPPT